MKKSVSIIIALILLLSILPIAQVAQADAPGTYHTGDIAIINGLVDSGVVRLHNQLRKIPADGSSVPSEWARYLYWSNDSSNKRIVEIDFNTATVNGNPAMEQRDVSVRGDLDLRGLDKLWSLRIDGGYTRRGYYPHEATSMNVSGCAELKHINCSTGPLTSIDLSGCTALDTFNCVGNNLTSIDLSENTALRFLSCGGNSLTSLDVSKNTVLGVFYCPGNSLTSLDVSKNTLLTALQCYNNALTSLDMSQNPALVTLDCYDNELTSLDVSQNPALVTLNCYNNALTSLDASKCSALYTLNCYNNELTSLDVSKCSALYTMNCSNNDLTSLDVSKCSALYVLNCKMNYLKKYKVIGIENVWVVSFDPQKPITADTTVIMRIDELYAVVDGIKARVSYDQDLTPIFNVGGRTMVPFRFLATAFGAEVDWDGETGSVIIRYKGKEIKMPMYRPCAYVDGVEVPINAPAEIMTFGRAFIPFRAIAELLDINVDYDSDTMTVIASDDEIDVAACVALYNSLVK